MNAYVGRVLVVLFMLICPPGLQLALAQTQLLTDAIVATSAEAETLRARAARCSTRLGQIDANLQRLNSDPVTNEAKIAEVSQARIRAQECVSKNTSDVATLDASLLQMQVDFIMATGISEEVMVAQMDALQSHEAALAVTRFDIFRTQRLIDRLNLSPAENAVLLAQKNAQMAALQAAQQAATEQIYAMTQSLQGTEIAATSTEQSGGSAELAWTMPVTRENGQPLAPSELAGYEIYMLSESTGESVVFVVNDPMAVNYTVPDLPPDTYHFSISAYDVGNHFSQLSQVVSKTII